MLWNPPLIQNRRTLQLHNARFTSVGGRDWALGRRATNDRGADNRCAHGACRVNAENAVVERESSHPQTRIRVAGMRRNPQASIFLLAVCAIARGDFAFFFRDASVENFDEFASVRRRRTNPISPLAHFGQQSADRLRQSRKRHDERELALQTSLFTLHSYHNPGQHLRASRLFFEDLE
jgi:hypothetical protein